MLSKKQSSFLVIGTMSGTSLDGLDLVATRFDLGQKSWRYKMLLAKTVPYPIDLFDRLKDAVDSTDQQIQELDIDLGQFIGNTVNSFSQQLEEKVDFVASHGHTVIHQPDRGITLQIGSGKEISENCNLPVINNFREMDVKLGGQGAPLVPIGDRDLFSTFDYCLNLGGIANLSFEDMEKMVAFDICPFNMALNDLSNQLGLAFDDGGELASNGEVDEDLLTSLNEISYLKKGFPKSLGLEDYRRDWRPLMEASKAHLNDKMCTYVEHAAKQVAESFHLQNSNKVVLITGGGALHRYFLSRLESCSEAKILVPDESLVNFKEALVFAYLGLLRYLEQPNCLASVTGSSKDSSGGDLYGF